MAEPRIRLDQLLIERGLFASRTRARAAIADGLVLVDGKPVLKPSQSVDAHAALDVDPRARLYVSRAAQKLAHALASFAIDPAGLECLDVGASTGGFTQVLLEKGAKHITAVDVGHAQLAAEIAADPRVTSIEGLNAKELTTAHVTGPIDLIVCDVSFIGLKKALPAALALAGPGAHLVALIKPQFEVGRERVGKGGIVRDEAAQQDAVKKVRTAVEQLGGREIEVIDSPILGTEGNKEFLLHAIFGTSEDKE
jgi:23S rRNA (cytidine1920-2'-O)/16S rRNA (cytidine1409-2'-O)-methyltransferase